MKLLTICIPCFNSIEIMHKSISSCLLMKDEVEVLIIDHQSTDETYQVAKEYEKTYPETIKVLTNNGDKQTISLAIEHAHGLYFKVLECEDYFDQASLVRVIETLQDIIRIQANLDLLITDFKIVIPGKKEKKISYSKMFPTETLFGWHSIKHIHSNNYLNFSSTIIKTNILRQLIQENDVNITFETYGYVIVPYIKSMYYLDTYFYCFGRKPYVFKQSQSEYYYQLCYDLFCYDDVFSLKSRKQRHYLIKYLSYLFMLTNILLIQNDDLYLKEQLWDELSLKNPKLFNAIKKRWISQLSRVDHQITYSFISKLYRVISERD